LPLLLTKLLANWKLLLVGTLLALAVGTFAWQRVTIANLRNEIVVVRAASEMNRQAYHDERAVRLAEGKILADERKAVLTSITKLLTTKNEIADVAKASPATCPPSPALSLAIRRLRGEGTGSPAGVPSPTRLTP
jgi:hypothetical protein